MSLNVLQSSLSQDRAVLHGYDLDKTQKHIKTDRIVYNLFVVLLYQLFFFYSYPVCMNEVLQFVGDQDHSPFIILQELEDSFLHQVITEVDVQRRERIVL